MNCTRIALLSGIVLVAAPALAQVTTLSEATYWLEAKSQQLVRQSRTAMNNGTMAFPPQAGGGYQAFWLRDYAYMLEGCPEAFTPQEMENSLSTFVNALSASGAGVDAVGFDGTPYYKPGYGTAGSNPVADGSQFTVDVAWLTYQQTHDTALISQVIGKLVQTMNAVPLDPTGNGLVYIDPNQAWDRCPWGFTDSVKETGDTLMCSLLDIRASNQLADLLTAVGQTSQAAAWRAAATKETSSVQTVFWNSSTGLFNAATVQNSQPDIMGSACAVQLGIATPAQSTAIANYFNSNYSSIVVNGQVRNLPGGTYWQNSTSAQGTYQNGGYWGVATGWFASTLSLVNPTKADQMLLDLVNNYKTNGVNEWSNSSGEPSGVANYCASATMPLILLKQLSPLPAQPVLTQIGGTLNSAADIALQSSGGTAFAENLIPGYPTTHTIADLNNGTYGDSSSWIGSTASSFCGVAFNRAYTISSLAFGRDNNAHDNGGGPYDDRYSGMYVFQYTQAANPNANTPDSQWTSFGSFALDTDTTSWGNGSATYLRHVYQFNPIANVTGVRILVDTANGANIAIDELEVYSAASSTWTGGGGSAVWSNASNWSSGASGASAAITFAGSVGLNNTNDLTGFNVGGITFESSAGAFTLGGNSLTLAGNVINSSTANQTINLNMALSSPSCVFNTASGNLQINGVLSGSGGLTAVGTGVLTLNNSNTYTGATVISSGTLTIAPNGSLPRGPSVSLNGGQLTLDVSQVFKQLQSTGAAETGNIVLANNSNLAINPPADNNNFYGNISGNGGLSLGDNSPLRLYGSLTYTGSTTVNGTTTGAVLVLQGSSTVLPAGTLLTIVGPSQVDLTGGVASKTHVIGGLVGNGSIYSYEIPATLDINVPPGQSYTYTGRVYQYPSASASQVSIIKDGQGTESLGGVLSSAGSVTVNAGELILSGSNTYTGGTYVAGGTLVVVSAYGLEDGSSLIVGADSSAMFGDSVSGAQSASLAASPGHAAPVPEPGTLGLLVAALIAASRICRMNRGSPQTRF